MALGSCQLRIESALRFLELAEVSTCLGMLVCSPPMSYGTKSYLYYAVGAQSHKLATDSR